MRFVLLAAWATACVSAPPPSAEIQTISPLIEPLSDGAVHLSGKVAVVTLWASWCRQCGPALHELEALQSPDVAVVTINVDADPRAEAAFLKAQSLEGKLLVLNDREARVVERKLAIARLPTTLIIDRTGRIRSKESGFTPQALLQNRIRTLLDEPVGK
jgi:thiol-disulfide isomerase/thioredoxin